MKNEIPHVTFDTTNEKRMGFEIVPIKRIFDEQKRLKPNPNQPHQLKFYNLILFTKGHGRHFIDFNWYPVEAGSIIYLAKEQVNAFELSPDLDGYCIIFTESYFVECFSQLPEEFIFRLFHAELSSPVMQVPSESDVWTYFQLLNDENQREHQFNHDTIVDSLFTILISKLEEIRQKELPLTHDVEKSAIFQRFTDLIRQHSSQERSAQFYAQELAISYKHLNTICKEAVHKTAKTVIDDFVILQAKRSLINSEMKSTELAYTLGFEDPTNFTKFFKSRTGFTPKAFKKSFKK